MARVGIFGGTFNPPHVGHLICAQEAADQLGLDHVLLMPVFRPPHKQAAGDPGPDARVELCRLATDGDGRISVSTLEVDRGGASYTVETLAALNEQRPSDELTFICGADMALSLPTWREPERVLSLARLAVGDRGDAERGQIERVLSTLDGGDRAVFFTMPRIDISSSMLRERIAAGRPIRYLAENAVAARIAQAGWYRSRAATTAPDPQEPR